MGRRLQKMGVLWGLLFTFPCLALAQVWTDGYNSHTRHINDIHITSNHDIFLFGGYPPAVGGDRIIFKVSEYGQNWYNWEVIDGNADRWILDVEYLSDSTAIAVGENAPVSLTTDGGNSWNSIYSDTARDLSGIDFSGSQYGLTVGGDSIAHIQTVKRTLDGGFSWMDVRDVSGAYLRAVHCINLNKSLAVGDNGTVLKTVNGGDNWTQISVPINRHFQDVHFFNSDVGIIVGGDVLIRTILRTIDGGDTWSIVMDEVGGMLNDVHFVNDLLGYAVGNHGQFLKTIDGGLNWVFQVVPNMADTDHMHTVNFKSENFGMMSGQWGRYFMYYNFDVPLVQTGGVLLESSGQTNFFGQVNSGGGAASVYFLYSTDPSMSNPDSTVSVMVNSTSLTPVTRHAWALQSNTTYYYTCKAVNPSGSATGDTLSFFADFGNGVTVSTDEPSNVTSSSVVLNGHVEALSLPSSVSFEYNEFGGNTTTVSANPATINDGAFYQVTNALSGLLPNTTYRYRLKIQSSQNIFYGQYRQFYTGTESEVITLPPTNISFTHATFNGHVEFLHLPTTLSFFYGPVNGNGQGQVISPTPSLVTDENGYNVTANATGLIPNTYYFVRLAAQNEFGMLNTITDEVFFTGIENAIETDPATGVTSTSAYLNGTFNEINSYPGSTWFQYYRGENDTVTIPAFPFTVHSPQTQPIQAFVNSLDPDTVYRFRVKVVDDDGVVYFGKERRVHTGENLIPNHDFESWTSVDVDKPDNWFNIMGSTEKISPGFSGNHAIKLEFAGDNQLGVIMNGALIPNEEGPNTIGGQPYTSRPDTLSGMFMYDLAPGDSALVWVIFKSEGQAISEKIHRLSGSSTAGYTQHKFPINYTSPDNPDTVLIGLLVPNLFGSTPPVEGDWLIVDDLKFLGNYPGLSNGGFENWTEYTFEHLDDWNYLDLVNNGFLNNPAEGIVSQSLTAQEGNFAVRLENLELGEVSGMAVSSNYYISSSVNTQRIGFVGSGGHPSFKLSHSPQALHGFYQFMPENMDTLFITVSLFDSGTSENRFTFIATEPALDFTPFTIDLDLLQNPFAPDSATIYMSTAGHSGTYGASMAIIDNLRFDGFTDVFDVVVDTELENERVPNQRVLKVYPNPSSEILHLRAEGFQSDELEVQIIDVLGKVIYNQILHCKGYTSSASINTAELRNGIYTVRVKGQRNQLSKLWVKY